MPLFNRELNELMDRIRRSDLTVWLHTDAPTEADPTNGRTSVGGGAYEAGKVVPVANISMSANGDIMITADIVYGLADEAVGLVTHWSAIRGANSEVSYGTLPNTNIGHLDSFKIDANTLQLNGSTT